MSLREVRRKDWKQYVGDKGGNMSDTSRVLTLGSPFASAREMDEHSFRDTGFKKYMRRPQTIKHGLQRSPG